MAIRLGTGLEGGGQAFLALAQGIRDFADPEFRQRRALEQAMMENPELMFTLAEQQRGLEEAAAVERAQATAAAGGPFGALQAAGEVAAVEDPNVLAAMGLTGEKSQELARSVGRTPRTLEQETQAKFREKGGPEATAEAQVTGAEAETVANRLGIEEGTARLLTDNPRMRVLLENERIRDMHEEIGFKGNVRQSYLEYMNTLPKDSHEYQTLLMGLKNPNQLQHVQFHEEMAWEERLMRMRLNAKAAGDPLEKMKLYLDIKDRLEESLQELRAIDEEGGDPTQKELVAQNIRNLTSATEEMFPGFVTTSTEVGTTGLLGGGREVTFGAEVSPQNEQTLREGWNQNVRLARRMGRDAWEREMKNNASGYYKLLKESGNLGQFRRAVFAGREGEFKETEAEESRISSQAAEDYWDMPQNEWMEKYGDTNLSMFDLLLISNEAATKPARGTGGVM